jgi:hypothetical protein
MLLARKKDGALQIGLVVGDFHPKSGIFFLSSLKHLILSPAESYVFLAYAFFQEEEGVESYNLYQTQFSCPSDKDIVWLKIPNKESAALGDGWEFDWDKKPKFTRFQVQTIRRPERYSGKTQNSFQHQFELDLGEVLYKSPGTVSCFTEPKPIPECLDSRGIESGKSIEKYLNFIGDLTNTRADEIKPRTSLFRGFLNSTLFKILSPVLGRVRKGVRKRLK